MKRQAGHLHERWGKPMAGPRSRPLGPGKRSRRGTILIVTMWILMALVGLVLVLGRSMRVEGGCSANEAAALAADAIEQGAIQYVLVNVDSLQGAVPSETDMPCQAVRLGDGAFWIIRDNSDNDREYAFGVVDEASKVNLNRASADMLSLLPGMTADLAASIVDWRDPDEVPSQGGADSSYYMLLDDPYQSKKSPLETVEELLLVAGMSREILYGEDTNRNGVLDINEDDANDTEPPDNRDGRLDKGPGPFVTVYSRERNVPAAGNPRINVDDVKQTDDLIKLLQRKDNRTRDQIRSQIQQIREQIPGRRYGNILRFYDCYCLRTPNGWTVSDFLAIAGRITAAGSGGSSQGLINVNTAPREVLTCLGLGENDVSALLAKRADGSADPNSIAWVLQALGNSATAARIGDYITTRSYQFSADIVSLAGNGRAFRRCRIVVDASNSPPKVVYRQDLTHLGWPLQEDILTRLRSGGSLDDIVVSTGSVSTSYR